MVLFEKSKLEQREREIRSKQRRKKRRKRNEERELLKEEF